MKTKITLGIVGLFLGLGFFVSPNLVSAAEPAASSTSVVISQADAVSLKGALDKLQVTLVGVGGYLKAGKASAADIAKMNVHLANLENNLSTLNQTLSGLPAPQKVTASPFPVQPKAAAAPLPKTQTKEETKGSAEIDESAPISENVIADSEPAGMQAFLTPKIVAGAVLILALIAGLTYTLRKKPRVESVILKNAEPLDVQEV